MFAVWPACNGADGISDIEHVAIEGMELLGKATWKAKPRWVAARMEPRGASDIDGRTERSI